MDDKKIYYYSCVFLVGIYTIMNYSNFDNSLILETKGNSKQIWANYFEYPSSESWISNSWWFLKTGFYFGLYLLFSIFISDKNNIANKYLIFISFLSVWFFSESTYLFNFQNNRSENIWTQFSIMPNQKNIGVVYGYKIIYLIGLVILSFKTITLKEKNQVMASIFIIILYLIIGVLFQMFGSSLLFLFKNKDDNQDSISWPSMMNYLDKYTNNSDFEKDDDSILSSQKVFNYIGYIRILLIVLVSGYISNYILNKDKSNIIEADNFTIISIILLTSVILITVLILSQIFITDGCVITRTNEDTEDDIEIETNKMMKSLHLSIQNQGGFYLHMIIIIIILTKLFY